MDVWGPEIPHFACILASNRGIGVGINVNIIASL